MNADDQRAAQAGSRWRDYLKQGLVVVALVFAYMAGQRWWSRMMNGQRLRIAMEQGSAIRSAVLPYWVDYGVLPPSLAHAGYRPRRGDPMPVPVERGYRVDVPVSKERLYFVLVVTPTGTEWTCITPDTKALVDAHPGCRYDPTFVRPPALTTAPSPSPRH